MELPQVMGVQTSSRSARTAFEKGSLVIGLTVGFAWACLAARAASAQYTPPASTPSPDAASVSTFIALHHEPETGQVLIEAGEDTGSIVHVSTLASQVDWPLDRGTIRFDIAPTILSFRVQGENLEVHALDPISGAASVDTLPIVGSRAGRWLADATPLLSRDAFGVAGAMAWVGENAVFDPARSFVLGSSIEQGTDFVHVDVSTTFDVAGGSGWLEERSEDPETLTVVQRHIFFTTGPGFAPVPTDGRVGINGVPIADIQQSDAPGNRVPRWGELTAPDDSGERIPLRIYIAPEIPHQHRAALRRAVDYWDRALKANGGTGQLEIRDLPSQADPLSLRYPIVFLWMDRPQPMSSMANLIADPRSGELVKGIIQIDSHWPLVAVNEYRAYRPALSTSAPTEAQYVEDRMAWVAAHEFGHLLGGLAHTISRPTAVGWRQPLLSAGSEGVEIELDGTLPEQPFDYDLWTLGYAYPGSVDRDSATAARFFGLGAAAGYWPVPPDLSRISPEAVGRVPDSRFLPHLENATRVRSFLLSHFDGSVLDPEEPPARVFERLFPVYFHHRFALGAVTRMVGGVTRDPGSMDFRPVPAGAQWSAIESITSALSLGELAVPQTIVDLVPGSASEAPGLQLRGESSDGSRFAYQTGNSRPIEVPHVPPSRFDPTEWARVLSRTTIEPLLRPPRLVRMEEQAGSDPAYPGPGDLLTRLTEELWSDPAPGAPELVDYDLVRKQVLFEAYLALLADTAAPESAHAAVRVQLRDIRNAIADAPVASDPAVREFNREVLRRLNRYEAVP